MVERYGLIKVPFPDEASGHGCSIFMSKEFYEPDQSANSTKAALVLI